MALFLHLVEGVEEVSTLPAVLTLNTALLAPRAFAREEQVHFVAMTTLMVALVEVEWQAIRISATHGAVLGEDTAVELEIIIAV